MQRVEDFQQRLPELESKMDAITATAAVVAAQTQMVAAGTPQVVTLVTMADDLNLQVTRIEGHRQAVESIEARLNALKTLGDTVDRKLKEQLGGRADVDGKLREGLSSRIAEQTVRVPGVAPGCSSPVSRTERAGPRTGPGPSSVPGGMARCYFASGSGRIWNFTLFCLVPGPPSRCHAA